MPGYLRVPTQGPRNCEMHDVICLRYINSLESIYTARYECSKLNYLLVGYWHCVPVIHVQFRTHQIHYRLVWLSFS